MMMTMMNKQVMSLFLLLLTDDLVLVSAGNRPGSGGGCDGIGPTRVTRNPTGAPTPDPGVLRRLSFTREVANPATLRSLQNRPGDNQTPFFLTEEDIALCCTGNGDFEFLVRDLDFDGLAVATEADGFKAIPGDSRWSCRRECRDPLNGFELEPCYEACDCRQNCPSSLDFLTTDCKATCNDPDPEANDLCLEICEQHCGERCRSTFNDYIVPLDLYAEGLEMLDCEFGDLIGNAAGSCNGGQAFWEASGYACQVTEGEGFDCECIVPGTCLNAVYPCDYQFYCVSNSPSLVPSESPSDAPSSEPTKFPTRNPTPRPTPGKAGIGKQAKKDAIRGRE